MLTYVYGLRKYFLGNISFGFVCDNLILTCFIYYVYIFSISNNFIFGLKLIFHSSHIRNKFWVCMW
jgi:hypothetical protein